MFKKKMKCARCGKKIGKDFDYCPYCGFSLRQDKTRKQEFNDFEKEMERALKMPFFVKIPFRQLVKQFEKQIDAQMRDLDKNLEKKSAGGKPVVSGLSISVSSDGEGKPIIKVGQFGKPQNIQPIITPEEKAEETAEKLTKKRMEEAKAKMTGAKAKKFAKLPKTEPETKVRRLTDRVIYEVALPGVKSIKDVLVNKLQNSIEIKAFAKDKAYFKLIPISLPVRNYNLENETLIIELIP